MVEFIIFMYDGPFTHVLSIWLSFSKSSQFSKPSVCEVPHTYILSSNTVI